MKILNCITLLLVVIGAINWGLMGFFQCDAVASVFGGSASGASRIIYSLVGLSGLYSIRWFCKCCKCCCKCCPKCGCSKCTCNKPSGNTH